MSFVNAHFVTYAQDLGYHPMVAAGIFSMIGACAITGALYLGHLSDKLGRRRLLGFSYQLRATGFLIVLLSMGIPLLGIPALGLGSLLFGVMLVGISWNSVVSITAAYASDRFGITNLGLIYGMMFAVMPLGSGLGASLGGYLHDTHGTYSWAIWSNIILLTLSAASVFSIKETKAPLPEAAAAD
ncbi:MAG: hypothetical protein BZY88_07500 [SAR202 cluster bacterium Io17-Chloro-G9]|nr:MAG: hypothetical protein BZY88_07500 [SAR202 cluster bacterium Io17-Chloro-G9]